MADGFKILAQAVLLDAGGAATASASDRLIYQVPDGSASRFGSRRISQAVISSIVVCHVHVGATSHKYTVRAVKNGTSPTFNDGQYLTYNKSIAPANTDVLSMGIGLVSGDAIYAEADAGGSAGTVSDISITIFGTEIV